jgi:hypothetical protein
MVKSKKSKILSPDLKKCVQGALRCMVQQLEQYTVIDLYGVDATDCTTAASKIYEDAKQIAINYIKKGVDL